MSLSNYTISEVDEVLCELGACREARDAARKAPDVQTAWTFAAPSDRLWLLVRLRPLDGLAWLAGHDPSVAREHGAPVAAWAEAAWAFATAARASSEAPAFDAWRALRDAPGLREALALGPGPRGTALSLNPPAGTAILSVFMGVEAGVWHGLTGHGAKYSILAAASSACHAPTEDGQRNAPAASGLTPAAAATALAEMLADDWPTPPEPEPWVRVLSRAELT